MTLRENQPVRGVIVVVVAGIVAAHAASTRRCRARSPSTRRWRAALRGNLTRRASEQGGARCPREGSRRLRDQPPQRCEGAIDRSLKALGIRLRQRGKALAQRNDGRASLNHVRPHPPQRCRRSRPGFPSAWRRSGIGSRRSVARASVQPPNARQRADEALQLLDGGADPGSAVGENTDPDSADANANPSTQGCQARRLAARSRGQRRGSVLQGDGNLPVPPRGRR